MVPFCKEAFLRPLMIVLLMIGYVLVYRLAPIASGWQHFAGALISLLVGALLIWFIGLKKEERSSVVSTVVNKFSK